MAAPPNREWPARASETLVDALRKAHELARAGEVGKPLADVLHFADDLLDIMADYVERSDAGEGERGAFMEMRERVAKLRGDPGKLASRARPGIACRLRW